MKSVWLLEQGEYSDYKVVAVYSTKEEAERVAFALDCRVSEVPLDRVFPMIERGYRRFIVDMTRAGEGTVHLADNWDVNEDGFDAPTKLNLWRDILNHRYMMSVKVWATDEQHAIKIANERRAVLIAEDQWPSDGVGPDHRPRAIDRETMDRILKRLDSEDD